MLASDRPTHVKPPRRTCALSCGRWSRPLHTCCSALGVLRPHPAPACTPQAGIPRRTFMHRLLVPAWHCHVSTVHLSQAYRRTQHYNSSTCRRKRPQQCVKVLMHKRARGHWPLSVGVLRSTQVYSTHRANQQHSALATMQHFFD
jgi:hypothetical protein